MSTPPVPPRPVVPKAPDAGAIARKAAEALHRVPSAADIMRRQQAPATPDPLADVEYTDDLAVDAALELTAMEVAYRERSKREDQRFVDATDSENWFAICFRTRAEKEAFLDHYRLRDIGDKYLDGSVVGRRLESR